jgi:hypothetical protein
MKTMKIIMVVAIILMLSLLVFNVSAAECVNPADTFISCGNNNTNCEFGFGDEIEGVTLLVNLNLDRSLNQIPVLALLCRDIACVGSSRLDDVGATTNELGIAEITGLDTSKITGSGTYYIKAILGPTIPELNIATIRNITIRNKAKILLNCPTEDFANRDIHCTYKVVDSLHEETKVPGYIPTVTISSGTLKPLISEKITFSTDKTGAVIVTLSVIDPSGKYLSSSESTIIEIKTPQNRQELLIDGESFFDIADGIATGTHELVFNVDKSGKDIAVNNIKATMTTPSGKVDDLVFIDSGTGFKTTYNFLQKATTYTLEGEVSFEDTTESDLLFEYPINTIGEITDPYKDNLTVIILSFVGGFVLLIIIIVGFMFLGRKKK